MSSIDLERWLSSHLPHWQAVRIESLVEVTGGWESDVYDLLAYTLERSGPRPVLLERDSNIPSLDELLAEVRQIDRTYQAAVARFRASRARSEVSHAA